MQEKSYADRRVRATLDEPAFLHAHGLMADMILGFDWASTPLGAIESWSTTLHSYVNLILSSPQPAVLIWGDDLTVLYNDGVIPTLGGRHPAALGRSYREAFADVWTLVGPDIEACFERGETPVRENVLIPLAREGTVQQNFYTYFLVPVYENNRIVGVYDPFLDVTQQRLDRLAQEAATVSQRFLLKLTDMQRSATDGRQIMQISVELLGRHLNAGRVGYAEASLDRSSMVFETGWAQGKLEVLSGTVQADHWSSRTATEFHRGRTVVYPDVRTEPGLAAELHNYLAVDAISVLAVPFLRRGVWRGSLYVNDAQPRLWTAEEVSLVEEVARRTAEAVERAHVEEDLRTLASRLGMAQQAGRMASWQWDFVTDTLVWDGGSEWTFGRPPAEMTHTTPIFSYIHEDDRERVRLALVPAVEGTGEYRAEFRVIWPDGSIHWVQAFGRTVWSFDGKATGIVGINVNTTDQKQVEATLMQTEKLAAVGRLASTIAHEINNPLEAVTNLLYLARHSSSLEEARPFLDTADAELRRASSITTQALRFHKQATRPTLSSFEQLTHDLFSGRHSRLKNVGAEVVERDRTTQPVLCLEGEIRQVLINLVTNAIDALSTTGGTLLLRGRDGFDWDAGKPGMVITVADTGPGMSQATQKRLFDAFFTTKGVGGTGLGLWVSKEIVERHGGRLRFRSRDKRARPGTVFTVFLPYDAIVSLKSSLPAVSVSDTAAGTYHGSSASGIRDSSSASAR